MRPGVMRPRLFVLSPYQPVVMDVSDDLEAIDREYRLSDEEEQRPGSEAGDHGKDRDRKGVVLQHQVPPPPRPRPLQARSLDVPRVAQPVREIRRRKPEDRAAPRGRLAGGDLPHRCMVVKMLDIHVAVEAERGHDAAEQHVECGRSVHQLVRDTDRDGAADADADNQPGKVRQA